jgi:neutral/alkaline ceramidase-like enzyme
MNSVVRAGFSKVDITPPLDWIDAHGIGYWYQRSVRFLGIRDPLFVRTLVIGTGEFRHVVISVDSIFDSYGFVAEASSRIASALGINADNVFITCTHTHSSPLIDRNNTRQGWEYGPFVADRIVQSATEADRNSVNSTVWTSAKPMENILYNRRPLLLNGRIPELHRPVARDSLADAGPVNNTMTIVKFRDDDGELLGGLCHFGIHGVAVQCSELVSGDCMGRTIQAAERQAGERVVFLHLNGPCGDIDPVLMGDDVALDTMTRRLHAGIEETLKSSELAISTPVPVNALHRIFRAKRRSTRPVAILERERQALLDISDKSSGFRHHSGAGYEAFLLSEEEKVSALPNEFDISY